MHLKKSLRFQALFAGLCLAVSAHAEIPISVQLTPTPDPTVLSSSGGTARYNRQVRNLSNAPISLNYRGLLIRPDGSEMPMTSDLSLNLSSNGSSNQTGLGFSVPSYFPAGDYSYALYYREPNKTGYLRQAFSFKKTGSNPTPTPRLSLALTSADGNLPASGGAFTIKARLNNISSASESFRVWSVLTMPNGDKRIPNEIFQGTLSAGSGFNLANAVINVSANDPAGDYRVDFYAISNSRNTPAITKRLSFTKADARVLISSVQLSDPLLAQCLQESAELSAWYYVDDVISLECQDWGVKSLSGLQQLIALQKLDLTDNDIRLVDTAELPATLQKLDLSNNKVELFGVGTAMPALTELELSNNRLTNLHGIEILNNLKVLNIAKNDLDRAADLQHVLMNLPQLTHLNLADIYLADSDVLNWIATLAQLQELDLSRTNLANSNWPYLPQLRVLRLAGNATNNLWQLSSYPNLRALDLSDNGLLSVSALNGFTLLEELILSGNTALRDDEVLTLLRNNPNIKRLGLADIVLSFDVVSEIVRGNGQNIFLEELDLANTDQQPQMLPFPNLRKLNLSNNPLRHLPPLPQPEKLESLLLANTLLREIPGFAPFYNLKALDLSGNNALPEGVILHMVWESPLLRELSLTNLRLYSGISGGPNPQALSQLQVLNLQDSSLNLTGLTLPKLKKLNLRNTIAQNPVDVVFSATRLRELDLTGVVLPSYWLPMQDLDALVLGDVTGLPFYEVEQMLTQSPRLRKLGLSTVLIQSGNLSSMLYPLAANLQWLDLSHTGLDRNAIQGLPSLPKLRHLDLSGNRSEDFFMPLPRLNSIALANMGLHQVHIPMNGANAGYQLRSLDLSGNTALEPWLLNSMLNEHEGLKSLKLDQINLSTFDLQNNLASREQLVRLSVRNSGVQWNSPVMPSLRHLALAGNDLSNMWLPPQLESLDLSNPVTPLTNWVPIANRLRELDLSNTAFEPHFITDAVYRNPMLRSLKIRGVAMQGMPLMAVLHASPDGLPLLQTLDVSTTSISDVHDLSMYPSLRELSLAGLGLQQVPTLPFDLRKLDIADNAIDYPSYFDSRSLRELNVSNNPNMQTDPLMDLIMRSPQLKQLAVASMPQLDFERLFAYGSSGYLAQLGSLNIANNNLPNLTSVGHLQSLAELNVSGNWLSDLDPLRFGLQNLRQVDLRENLQLSCMVIDEVSWLRPTLNMIRPQHCPSH